MQNKYFINFIHGYFNSLHDFTLSENYHLHTFLVAKQAGYNKFICIVKGGCQLMKQDLNLKVLQKNGIEILILDYKNILNFILILFKYSFLAIFKKTLFYFNSHEIITYFAIIFVKIFSVWQIKNIFMAHTQSQRSTEFKNKVQDFIFYFVDRIRLNNFAEQKFLENRNIDSKELFIVPLVVDNNIFKKTNFDYENRHDLVYFGQITKKKNLNIILRALRMLLDENVKYKNLKLNIIGKIGQDYDLERDLIDLDLQENVVKYGFVKQDEKLNKLLNSFLISVNSSKDEGQCLTVFESAMSGCALCLPKIMSFVEIFQDKALFHNANDAKKLVENILFFLENRNIIPEQNEKSILMIEKEYDRNTIEEKMKELFRF